MQSPSSVQIFRCSQVVWDNIFDVVHGSGLNFRCSAFLFRDLQHLFDAAVANDCIENQEHPPSGQTPSGYATKGDVFIRNIENYVKS